MLNRFLQFAILLCLAAGTAAAQPGSPPPPTPKPLPKTKVEPKEKSKYEKDKAEKAETPEPPSPPRGYRPRNEPNYTTEKVIASDPAVAVKFCISDGTVRINGSETNEVRVFVREGRKFEFKTLENDEDSGKANSVLITRIRPASAPAGPISECLSGESIELDVPFGATIDLTARAADATIDSVKKVTVRVSSGKIDLRNVNGGVFAVTNRGDVTLGSSSGDISLETTTGNVLMYDVKPGQVGNQLRVKTNSGNLLLQNVSHRQIDAGSISGTIGFDGKLMPGGIYKFKSSNGSIRMLLPNETDCRVVASYGYGSFESEIPMKIITATVSPGGKGFVALIGKKEAAQVNITTAKGGVMIRTPNRNLIP